MQRFFGKACILAFTFDHVHVGVIYTHYNIKAFFAHLDAGIRRARFLSEWLVKICIFPTGIRLWSGVVVTFFPHSDGALYFTGISAHSRL